MRFSISAAIHLGSAESVLMLSVTLTQQAYTTSMLVVPGSVMWAGYPRTESFESNCIDVITRTAEGASVTEVDY